MRRQSPKQQTKFRTLSVSYFVLIDILMLLNSYIHISYFQDMGCMLYMPQSIWYYV